MTEPLFPAQIVGIELAAEDILSFTLRPLDSALPTSIDPGSHVDVHLPNGMMRSYSLSNGPDQRTGYRLTVARDANGRGGSVYMHDRLRVGQTLEISMPRNNFELAEDAPMSVFFAGGIGVTPFVPMVARLNATDRPWRLYYCTRDRKRAAHVDELLELANNGPGELIQHADDTDGILDLAGVMATLPSDNHVYCCGPKTMLDAFRSSVEAVGISDEKVHFEYFNADVESATDGGFVVVLNRSGAEIAVEPGQTILQALVNQGVDVPFSCEEGICGACETPVVEGEPDHRDIVLSEAEKRASKTMMICCSGSRSRRLILDL